MQLCEVSADIEQPKCRKDGLDFVRQEEADKFVDRFSLSCLVDGDDVISRLRVEGIGYFQTGDFFRVSLEHVAEIYHTGIRLSKQHLVEHTLDVLFIGDDVGGHILHKIVPKVFLLSGFLEDYVEVSACGNILSGDNQDDAGSGKVAEIYNEVTAFI